MYYLPHFLLSLPKPCFQTRDRIHRSRWPLWHAGVCRFLLRLIYPKLYDMLFRVAVCVLHVVLLHGESA